MDQTVSKKNRLHKHLFTLILFAALTFGASTTALAQKNSIEKLIQTNDKKYGYVSMGNEEELKSKINSKTISPSATNNPDALTTTATGKIIPRKTSAPPVEGLPWRSDAGLRIAETQIVSGKYAQAVQTLNQVLARHPANVDAHTYLGYCNMKLNLDKKAAKSLDLALRLDGKHMGAHLYIGLLHLKKGEKALAVERLAALRTICQGKLCSEENYLADQINNYKKKQKTTSAKR